MIPHHPFLQEPLAPTRPPYRNADGTFVGGCCSVPQQSHRSFFTYPTSELISAKTPKRWRNLFVTPFLSVSLILYRLFTDSSQIIYRFLTVLYCSYFFSSSDFAGGRGCSNFTPIGGYMAVFVVDAVELFGAGCLFLPRCPI